MCAYRKFLGRPFAKIFSCCIARSSQARPAATSATPSTPAGKGAGQRSPRTRQRWCPHACGHWSHWAGPAAAWPSRGRQPQRRKKRRDAPGAYAGHLAVPVPGMGAQSWSSGRKHPPSPASEGQMPERRVPRRDGRNGRAATWTGRFQARGHACACPLHAGVDASGLPRDGRRYACKAPGQGGIVHAGGPFDGAAPPLERRKEKARPWGRAFHGCADRQVRRGGPSSAS